MNKSERKRLFLKYVLNRRSYDAYVLEDIDLKDEFLDLLYIYDRLKSKFDEFRNVIESAETLELLQMTGIFLVETSKMHIPLFYGTLSATRDRIISLNLKSKKAKKSQPELKDRLYIKEMFSSAFNLHSFIQDILEPYCYEDHSLIRESTTSFILSSNRSKECRDEYEKNGFKLNQANKYLYNSEMYSTENKKTATSDENIVLNSMIEKFVKIYSKILYTKYGISINEKIYIKNKTLDLSAVLVIMSVTAAYSESRYNKHLLYSDFNCELAIKGFFYERPVSLMEGTNEMVRYPYILRRINDIIKFFKPQLPSLSDNEFKEVINFLSLDINKKKAQDETLNSYLFIKENDDYYWMSAGIMNLSFDTVIYNRLERYLSRYEENDSVRYQKNFSDSIEKMISKMFKNAGFNSVNSINYKYEDKMGEFDVLAYCPKTKILFIVEHKNSSMVRSTVKDVYTFKDRLFKSEMQLDKGLTFIKDHFNDECMSEIKKSLNINSELKDITLFPLITATSFEFDRSNDLKYPKISLFELNMLLHKNAHFGLIFDPDKPVGFIRTYKRIYGMAENEFNLYMQTALEYEKVLQTQLTTDDIRNTNLKLYLKEFFESDEVIKLEDFISDNLTKLSKEFKIWDENGAIDGLKLKDAIENDKVWKYFWYTENITIPQETRKFSDLTITIAPGY